VAYFPLISGYSATFVALMYLKIPQSCTFW
jgi:hypothetical protein